MESFGELIVYLGANQIERLQLTRPLAVIGRLPENDLVLAHPAVQPRAHAELRIEAGRALLTDLGAPAGTLVDGTRLLPNRPHELPDGGRFQIGPFTIEYVPAGEVARPQPAPQEAASTTPAPVVPVAPASVRRESQPRLLPDRDTPARYLAYLPAPYQDLDSFFSRYLKIFEAIWEPYEQRQSFLALYFDPRTCPASFLPWLASWLGLPLDPALPEERARALVREAYDLYAWRGTEAGLARLLELSTGAAVRLRVDPNDPSVLRVQVGLPAESPELRTMVERLVRAHKPAHLGYVLELD